MKILLLCNRIPYPPKDGGAIAIYNMIKGYYEAGAVISVFSINTHKHFIDPDEIPEDEVLRKINLYTVPLDTDISISGALKNLISGRSYHVERFYVPEIENKLKQILNDQTFDIIQFEEVFMADYVNMMRAHSDAKIIMRAHNVEHRIWEKVADRTKNPLKRSYIQLQAKRLKKFEESQLNNFDAVLPITPDDQEYFRKMGCKKPMHVVPVGIEAENYEPDWAIVDYKTLFHIGSMDWIPNQEAVVWFLQNIWPRVLEKVPETNFDIAGRFMPDWISQYRNDHVRIAGEVEDAYAFMRSRAIMVVPLLSGSGMRVKILEGMALGKCIVSTTLGAQGIDCKDGEEILIADTPEEFAGKVIKCLESFDYCRKIGEKAREKVLKEYDLSKVAERTMEFLGDIN